MTANAGVEITILRKSSKPVISTANCQAILGEPWRHGAVDITCSGEAASESFVSSARLSGFPSGRCLPLSKEQPGRRRLRSCSSLVPLGFEDCSCMHCGRVLSRYIRVAKGLAMYFTSCMKDGLCHPDRKMSFVMLLGIALHPSCTAIVMPCHDSAHGLGGPQATDISMQLLPLLCYAMHQACFVQHLCLSCQTTCQSPQEGCLPVQ